MADLTTLDAVKAELDLHDDNLAADDRLGRLISAVSNRFESDTDRVIGRTTHTEIFDGNGRCRILLGQYPVASVTSVTVDGQVIPQRAAVTGSGWVLREDRLELVGYTFSKGVGNVEVVYQAGFDPVPSDVVQAVLETVCTRYRTGPSDHIQSSSVAAEFVQLRQFEWSPFAYGVIRAYKRPSLG